MAASSRTRAVALHILTFLSLISHSEGRDTKLITGTNGNGVTKELAVDRYPTLYTGDFGDCLGGQSLFNVTKFDAAYYTDNLTVVFHLDGASNIKNDSLMLHLSFDAYGQSRFDLTIDPCRYNVTSLCPLTAGRPITAWAAIPVTTSQMGGIPDVSFSMPDLEGSARLQILSNSSKTEIGCFQAVMWNGATFSHPEIVAPILVTFTVVAIAASFITAAYGVSIPHMRMHHAHSLSVLVVFETFQYIFFSGALSVNWPSILIGWWGNFAWSAGQIYSTRIISSLDSFTGINGNASQVGGAGSTVIANGGGLITSIFGRSLTKDVLGTITKRATYNESDPYDYTWSGNPVTPGMPTPGTWYGFAGDLSGAYIPAADAFMVGLIWFLVAVGLVALCLTVLKYSFECLARLKWIQEDRMASFRRQWVLYLKLALLRTFFVAFFMMTTLSLYQLSINGSKGATAVAAVVFILFLIGGVSLAVLAIHTRTKLGKFEVAKDQIVFHQTKLFKTIPFVIPIRASTLKERDIDVNAVGAVTTLPFFRIRHINKDSAHPTVHQDEEYLKKFGWLTSRHRRTRWWFFAYYAGYQLVRACFLGGGTMNPMAQVYGLLAWEIIAFIVVLQLNPWEGTRNTSMAVYLLGFSKILVTALSIAFLPGMNTDRLTALSLGIAIMAIQGLLVVAMLILIVLSAISSWLSLTRNQQDFEPDWLDAIRVKYFIDMEEKAPDSWLPQKSKDDRKGKGIATDEDDDSKRPQIPRPPSFSVSSVRRAPKIEDEEDDVVKELEAVHNPTVKFDTNLVHGPTRAKRASSVSSRHSVSSLRKSTGRPHRTSWSAKDFAQWDALHSEGSNSSLSLRPGVANGSTTGPSPLSNTIAESTGSSSDEAEPSASSVLLAGRQPASAESNENTRTVRIQTPPGTRSSTPSGPSTAAPATSET